MEPHCPWCEQRALVTHEAMRDKLRQCFEREYHRAFREHQQLEALYKNVCWYHFETSCRSWQEPWHVTWSDSFVTFHGHSYATEWRGGRLREFATFPLYYFGMISEAPKIPPEIVLKELKAAEEYMHAAYMQIYAPDDWAPGGHKYERLVREGEGAQAYHALYSQRQERGEHGNTA